METKNNRRFISSETPFDYENKNIALNMSPVWRRLEMAQATLGSEEGTNPFLLALVDPWSGPSNIPDLDMSPSIQKTVKYTMNFKNLGGLSGSGMIVMPWHSKRDRGRIYVQDPVGGKFNYLQDLLPDQDISQSFAMDRFVSGGLIVQSATVAGGAYSVSGTIQAISYQDPPSFRTLTYNNLLSQANAPENAVGSIPIQDGIVGISQPPGHNRFLPSETNALFSSDTKYTASNTVDSSTLANGWTQTNQTTAVLACYDDSLAGSASIIPPNCYGKSRISFRVNVGNAGAAVGTVTMSLRVTYVSADALSWQPVFTTVRYDFQACITNAMNETMTGEVHIDDPREIFNIQLFGYSPVASAANITGAPGSGGFRNYNSIHLENYNTPGSGAVGPGNIIMWQGVGDGQQIAINGVANYEAVPDSLLAQNVGTGYMGIENPMDIKVAELCLADFQSTGVRFVYPLAEYKLRVANGWFADISRRRSATLHAAGLMSGIRNAFDFIKPFARQASPYAGAMLGTYLGNPGMGAAFGGAIGNTLFSASGEKEYRLNCSGPEKDQQGFGNPKQSRAQRRHPQNFTSTSYGGGGVRGGPLGGTPAGARDELRLVWGQSTSTHGPRRGGPLATVEANVRMEDREQLPYRALRDTLVLYALHSAAINGMELGTLNGSVGTAFMNNLTDPDVRIFQCCRLWLPWDQFGSFDTRTLAIAEVDGHLVLGHFNEDEAAIKKKQMDDDPSMERTENIPMKPLALFKMVPPFPKKQDVDFVTTLGEPPLTVDVSEQTDRSTLRHCLLLITIEDAVKKGMLSDKDADPFLVHLANHGVNDSDQYMCRFFPLLDDETFLTNYAARKEKIEVRGRPGHLELCRLPGREPLAVLSKKTQLNCSGVEPEDFGESFDRKVKVHKTRVKDVNPGDAEYVNVTDLPGAMTDFKDSSASMRFNDMFNGLNTEYNSYSKANGIGVSDSGEGYLLPLFVTESPLIDDRFDDPYTMKYFAYRRVFDMKLGPQLISKTVILFVCEYFGNSDAGLEAAMEQLLYAAAVAGRTKVYVTIFPPEGLVGKLKVSGPSIGLAAYSAMCNFPFGPILTGALGRVGDLSEPPSVEPVGQIRAKAQYAAEKAQPLIVPYAPNTVSLPGLATPLQIAKFDVIGEDGTPPNFYAISGVSQLPAAIMIGSKVLKEVRSQKGQAALEEVKNQEAYEAGKEIIAAGVWNVDAIWTNTSKVTQKKVDELIKVGTGDPPRIKPVPKAVERLGNYALAYEKWATAQAAKSNRKVTAPQSKKKRTPAPAQAVPKRKQGFNANKLKELRAQLGTFNDDEP